MAMDEGRRRISDAKPRIVIAANSAWNLRHFRAGLIRALVNAGYDVHAAAPLDAGEAEAAGLASGWSNVPVDRSGLNPLADVRLMARYLALFRKFRARAFLGFTIKPNIYGCLAARLAGIPAIPNISGLGTAFIAESLISNLVRRLYRLALARAPVVFFQNADDRDQFVRERLVRPEQARLLPGSGIDLERFEVTLLPSGPARFLMIARLLGDKGVREYVEAAWMLRERLPGARFQLLGPIDDGNRTAIRRGELDRWVSEGAIDYLGSTDDVRPHLANASAIVLPSYREGLPRSLLEGAAMARPLIATDVPGCREVVEDGVNGFLCAVQDPRSLADAMAKFAQLPMADREAMGAASRRKVQERFSEEVVIQAYLNELARIETLHN